jgi:hypothetical protein
MKEYYKLHIHSPDTKNCEILFEKEEDMEKAFDELINHSKDGFIGTGNMSIEINKEQCEQE